MRTLNLTKNGINKFRAHQLELKASDFEDSIKSLPPGEWCLMKISATEHWVGFINPLVDEKFTCAYLVSPLETENLKTVEIEKLIEQKIRTACERRRRFNGYEKNSRLFYGMSDGLPGLIVDQFENASIVQINTAGIDRYRELIKNIISSLMDSPCYYLDNPKYREKESLPTFPSDGLPEIHVVENGLHYRIRSEVLQKVGFYYDHRENRYHLMNLLGRLTKKPQSAVDLFSYVGAWGMSALQAGAGLVEFVDQGDFTTEVERGLKLNGFEGHGRFIRGDVFKYLDETIQKNRRHDLVLCDPPAFAKSALQKTQALEGYSKLHRKVFKIMSDGGIAAFSSCTHYVGHTEFTKNIQDAAARENKKIQLVYTGIQGFDHPVVSLEDRSNYIKSYFYIVG